MAKETGWCAPVHGTTNVSPTTTAGRRSTAVLTDLCSAPRCHASEICDRQMLYNLTFRFPEPACTQPTLTRGRNQAMRRSVM